MKHNISRSILIIFVLGLLYVVGSNLSFDEGVRTSLAYPAPPQQQDAQGNPPPYPGPLQGQPVELPPIQQAELSPVSNPPTPTTRKYAEEIQTPPDLQAVLSSLENSIPINQFSTTATDTVGWSTLFFDDSPLKNHQWPCDTTLIGGGSSQNKWGSTYYDVTYQDATWPAAEGTPVRDPFGLYPQSMNTFFVCGRHDLSQFTNLRVQFDALIDLPDDDDYLELFLTSAVNQKSFHVEYRKPDSSQNWRSFTMPLPIDRWSAEELDGAWLAFRFISDGDSIRGNGVWLDNIKTRVYQPPTKTCGDFDPGNKGLNTPSRYPWNDTLPAFSGDDLSMLHKIDWAKPGWVRMVFHPMNGATIVDLEAFDFMVDNLCEKDISVLAVVNEETIPGIAYDPGGFLYREQFANEAAMLAEHFTGRITYWEVWNEPNLGNFGNPPRVEPIDFAPLLQRTYNAIKQVNPNAQIVYGGLAQAFEDTQTYFFSTQTEFGGIGIYPYDVLGSHPYTDGRQGSGGCATPSNPNRDCHGIDPQTYMFNSPGYNNIFDPFLESMANRGHGDTNIWATEIGWNSSLGSGLSEPTCQAHALVYETDQADYLKPGFDIMFNDITLWGQSENAIEKAFWFGLMDFALLNEEVGCADIPPDRALSMSFGLYRGDLAQKPVWCDFRAYPDNCEDLEIYDLYLPLTVRDGSGSQAATIPLTTPLLSSTQTNGSINIAYIFYDGEGRREPDEYVEIQNNDSQPIQVQGWTVQDLAGHSLIIPYLVMQPGQLCRIYTNEQHAQWCGLSYQRGSAIWNNRGDTAILSNKSAVTVDTCSYPRQSGTKGVFCVSD